MRIYIVRHGQSVANFHKTVQGTMDSPLTEKGREQAKNLFRILPEMDHIYASPLSRAFETASLAMKLSPEEIRNITTFDELMEINFGDLQGIKYNEVPFERETIRRHVRFEEDILKGEHNAETLDQFFERSHTIFQNIVEEAIRNNWNTIAIFTHGGILRSLIQYYLRLSKGRYDNTEIALLQLDSLPKSKKNLDIAKLEWKLERLTDHIDLG